jgi:PAS domain-containing protein
MDTERPEWLTQMETVLEVLNEGVVIANDDHRILFANSRFVEMTGIPRQDMRPDIQSQFEKDPVGRPASTSLSMSSTTNVRTKRSP